MSIVSEDDLIIYVGKRTYSKLVYPRVKIISRTIEVSPDIDLLEFAERYDQNRSEKYWETVGYEIKFIRYRKRWKRYVYDPIYSGIGQALLYLNNGVEKVNLVVGFEIDSIPQLALDKLMRKFEEVMSMLVATKLNTWLGMRIVRLHKGSVSSDQQLAQFSAVRFPKGTPDFNYRKDCLFKREFSWDEKLYDRMHAC